MCGIAGIAAFREARSPVREQIHAMCETIVHRGPNDEGIHVQGGVGLGMRRLSIIDLGGGRQPIWNEERTVLTVFNGEIYNYRELRRDLEARGHRFATHSDTEVIVHGYEEYGRDFPAHLNGMFAIALHDTVRRKLVLVRDHIGIKPLYYSFTDARIVFGSEVKVLLASGLVKRDLDIDAVGQFLSWEYVPGAQTLLTGVERLEPGHLLEIDLSNPICAPRRYWDIPMVEATARRSLTTGQIRSMPSSGKACNANWSPMCHSAARFFRVASIRRSWWPRCKAPGPSASPSATRALTRPRMPARWPTISVSIMSARPSRPMSWGSSSASCTSWTTPLGTFRFSRPSWCRKSLASTSPWP